MTETSFDQVITEHLTLCERNKRLERAMPLDGYRDRPAAEPAEAEELATQANAVPREDPPSWWETKDGECPPPPLDFDWDR
ncbi:MAG: hypothetical protein WAL31_06450 [Gaiellaceae bacterium]